MGRGAISKKALFQPTLLFNPKLRFSTAVKCDPVSITHLLFISRTIEADSGTQSPGPQKWESEPIRAILLVSSLPLMSQ
jgi:hypothetical protein